MNTGLLFRRIGESSYSRFSRFLSANQSIDINEFKNLFLKANIERKYLMSNTNKNTEGWMTIASKIYENRFIKTHSLSSQEPYKKLLKGYRPKKSCNSCAKSGFHTYIFDNAWLSICPIHNEKLTAYCNLCNNQWPTPHELMFKKCKQCGPKKDISKLFIDREFNSSKLKALNRLNKIIHNGKKAFSKNIQLYNFETNDSFNRINNYESSFFLSAIKYQNRNNLILDNFKLYDVLESTFRFNKENYKPDFSKVEYKHIEKIKYVSINNIYSLVVNILEINRCCDNKCKLENFPSNVCIHCSTLYVWRILLGKNCINNNDQRIDFIRLYSYGFMPNEPQFYTTLKIINQSESSVKINLPTHISSIIYENDLWTTSILIYNMVKNTINKFESWIHDDKEFKNNIYRENMTLSKKNIFTPYFLKLYDGRIKIIYPDIQSNNLDLNEDLISLIA